MKKLKSAGYGDIGTWRLDAPNLERVRELALRYKPDTSYICPGALLVEPRLEGRARRVLVEGDCLVVLSQREAVWKEVGL